MKDFESKIISSAKCAKHCFHKAIKCGASEQWSCFIFWLKMTEKLWSYGKCQNTWSLEETVWSYEQKCVYSGNLGQSTVFGAK